MTRRARPWVAGALVLCSRGGVVVLLRTTDRTNRTKVVAYFENSNGVFVGDDVRILGVPVGKIASIEPQPESVKISFWYDSKYRVPADAKAAILSPTVVSTRAIQLTPAYTGGPVMADNAVIPRERTAVPVEWDDVRKQLAKLTEELQPTEPGGVSPLGSVINTAADNLRGQGANIRDTIIKLSQAFSALGDHSTDIFSTVKNLAILVSALQDSTDLMRQLNQNLATVTGLLADDPDEVANAVRDLNNVVGEVQTFVADNREALGTTSDKLAGVTQALTDSLDDVKQVLHVAPTTLQNYVNIWQPAQGAVSAVPMLNNFANPISFLCGAVQAASRLGAEQSAKLCVQYLAPIIKNRQYNFLPFAQNLFVGATTRPNELTYSEDWLRPDYIPPQHRARRHNPPPAAGAPPPDTGRRCRRGTPAAAERGDEAARSRRTRLTVCTGSWCRRESASRGGWDRDARQGVSRTAVVVAAAVFRLRRLARAEFDSAAGCPGHGARRVHHPGADARRRQHRAEFPRPGRRRQRRHREEARASGLACTGDDAAERRRRSARECDGQARSDQPAGFTAHRAGPADRRTARRQAARRLADPIVVVQFLPSTEEALAAVAMLLNGGGIGNSRHHRRVEHRLRRSRERLAQPDRAARPSHRTSRRPEERHHRRRREPEQPDRSVRRAKTRGGQGVTDDPGCAGRPQRRARQPGRGARTAGQVQRAGRRLGQPDQGSAGPRTQRSRAGAASRWPTPALR